MFCLVFQSVVRYSLWFAGLKQSINQSIKAYVCRSKIDNIDNIIYEIIAWFLPTRPAGATHWHVAVKYASDIVLYLVK